MIKSCKCVHKGQDKLNGKGKRVYNETAKGTAQSPVYRCTVCGHTTETRSGF